MNEWMKKKRNWICSSFQLVIVSRLHFFSFIFHFKGFSLRKFCFVDFVCSAVKASLGFNVLDYFLQLFVVYLVLETRYENFGLFRIIRTQVGQRCHLVHVQLLLSQCTLNWRNCNDFFFFKFLVSWSKSLTFWARWWSLCVWSGWNARSTRAFSWKLWATLCRPPIARVTDASAPLAFAPPILVACRPPRTL